MKALTSKSMMPLPRCHPIALHANRDKGAHDDVYNRLKVTAVYDSPSQCISRETCSVTSSSKTMYRLSSDPTKASRARFSCLYSGQAAKTYLCSVVAGVPATAFFANPAEAVDAAHCFPRFLHLLRGFFGSVERGASCFAGRPDSRLPCGHERFASCRRVLRDTVNERLHVVL